MLAIYLKPHKGIFLYLMRQIQRRHNRTERKKRTTNSRKKCSKICDPLPIKVEENVFVEVIDSEPIIEVTVTDEKEELSGDVIY